jgi:glycosyltransferase involved in cell wall biosynthesis
VTVRILFVTQKIDADHPVLAQTVDVVRELAGRCETLDVLCDEVGRHDLPPNVRLRTFGARTRAGRVLRFARGLAAALLPRRRRPDAVLVHMVPLFVLLAAPLAKPLRVPLLLWYTHWRASRSLRLALPLVDAVLSVSAGSFPLATSKIRPTGHAIDVERFAPQEAAAPSGPPLRLLALGRTARWKGYDTMLAALELAVARGGDVLLEIRGPQLTDDERAHRRELEATVAGSSRLRDRVRLEPPLPRDELPSLLAGAHALVSATQPRGSETLDKVVYEAAACGVPVLASNTALDEFLGGLPLRLRFPPRDAEALADLLLELAAAPAEAHAAAGAELRRRVVQAHSLQSWAGAVAAVLAGQHRE